MPSTWRPCSSCSSERSLARILARAAEQQPVAPLARHRLDARDDLDEERVHQIGNDDAERVGAPEASAIGRPRWADSRAPPPWPGPGRGWPG